MNPLVSVVIANHNNWPDVEMAIQSALCQSYTPIEVIVVDSGSTDDSARQIEHRFAGRVRLERRDNAGDAAAYNIGLRLASGAFVQFLDGDDVLAPCKIERQVACLAAAPDASIAYGDMRFFQSSPGQAAWLDWDVGPFPDVLERLSTPGAHMFGAHSLLFKREVFEAVGEWTEGLYVADLDLWLRAAANGIRFVYCPGSLYFHRVRRGQMSENFSAMLRGREQVWSRALDYVPAGKYRDGIATQLAQTRYSLAIRRAGMSRAEALEALKQARVTAPPAISQLAYALGVLLIVVPFGERLAAGPSLLPFRKRLRAFFRFP